LNSEELMAVMDRDESGVINNADYELYLQDMNALRNLDQPVSESAFMSAARWFNNIISDLDNCPNGMQRFYLAQWDNQGYCGIPNDTAHCLEHHIYVPNPSGSVDEHSTHVFDARINPGSSSHDNLGDVIDGYACVLNQVVFTIPRPEDVICPNNTRFAGFPNENYLQYICAANNLNEQINNPVCSDEYQLVKVSAWGFSEGLLHFFTCGFNGFQYPYQYMPDEDGHPSRVPCSTSGARELGGDSNIYECAYLSND